MGGSVGVTIRKENSDIIKMARRTGSYNALLISEEFNYGDKNKAIDDFIAVFSEMREDYLRGGPYKFHMTPEYGWCDVMIPYGYGLVVLDFQNKKIHSLQGYDTPGFTSLVNIINNDETDEENITVTKMLKEPELLLYNAKGEQIGYVRDFLGEDITISTLSSLFKKTFESRNLQAKENDNKENLNVIYGKLKAKVLHDFDIIKYNESAEGFLLFAKNLKNDGFEFTEEEIAEWLDYAATHFLDDFEPEDVAGENYNNMSGKEYQDALDTFKKSYIQKLENVLNLTNNIKMKNKF